jgi:hypothetical protein
MRIPLLTRALMGLLFAAGAVILAAPPARADDGDNPGAYQGPDACTDCHPEQAAAWADAPHANAARVEAFVTAWETAGSPSYCLACHTTGFDAVTGQYAFEGVTCESCHGPLTPGHPEQPMAVNTSPEACGVCHKSTLNEWQFSRHGLNNIGCAACHDVHGATIKTGESTQLCGTCHTSAASGFTHATSAGQGIACADCHIGPRGGDPAEGHANTGHTFMVGTTACSRCHANEIHQGLEAMMGSADPNGEVQPTPAPTQAPEAIEAAAPRPAASMVALPVVGSALLGAGVGFGWARWRERQD